jgi:hypothetical protein
LYALGNRTGLSDIPIIPSDHAKSGRFYAHDIGLGLATTARGLKRDAERFYALDIGLGLATSAAGGGGRKVDGFYALDIGLGLAIGEV